MKLSRKSVVSVGIALALLLMAAFVGGCSGGAREHYTICIGHSDTSTNLLHISLEHFAEAVRERTDGRVEVVIFSGEQLGTNAEMLRMVEMGKLDAMMLPAGQQAALCPKFKVLGLPFLFSGYAHVYQVLDGEIGEELLEGLEEHNLVQLAYWENGLRQITNNRRAIETPSDLAGLKFRTPEDAMTVSIFAAYGAEASAYPFSELYLALQQGLFDGQENPVANIYANQFQDVQQYLTMVNYQYQPKNMIFSLRTWNTLPREIQTILRETARTYGNEHRQAIVDSEEEMLQELVRDGMNVGYPDTAPFIQQAESVYQDFYREYDWAEDLVARIRAVPSIQEENGR